MPAYGSYFWKRNPFIRLLLPMMAGIAVQWSIQINIIVWEIILVFSIVFIISFFFIPFLSRYRFHFLNGLVILVLFFSFGAMLAWQKDIRHHEQWFENFYKENDGLIVILNEPPVEKTKSIKADALVSSIYQNGKQIPVKGKIVLYFKKDSTLLNQFSYGSKVVFKNPLQEIKNSGNPGGFNYKRYALFHGITHQVYLKPGDFIILKDKNENWLDKFLYQTRQK